MLSKFPIEFNKEKTALLIINGEEPFDIPNLGSYAWIACTDGALDFVKKSVIDRTKIKFISGDFDSVSKENKELYSEKLRFTPDQDFTDFYKALHIIKTEFPEIDTVHVLGCGGKEMDHFLGNLTVAHKFKNDFNIILEDNYSTYFFVEKDFVLTEQKNKTISLYPFPETKIITTSGLHWSLKQGNLGVTAQIGTRNRADSDEVKIHYTEGDLLVFISKNYS